GRVQWRQRAEKRFDCTNFRDGSRTDLVTSTNAIRHPSHDESAWQLKQPLLVQLGKTNRPPVPPRVAGRDDQDKLIVAEEFITQVGWVMRQNPQPPVQSTLFQRRLNVIGRNFRDGDIDTRMPGGEKPQ